MDEMTADDTGELEPGQVIESINGQTLSGIDPRIQLGDWITQAEATDARMVLMVRDPMAADAERWS